MNHSPKALVEIAERVCALARRAGADGAEVQVQSGSELEVKVRLGEPELIHQASSKALGMRVFRDHRAALTYTSDFTPNALESFARDSVELANLAEPDPLNELPDPEGLARALPELDLWDEAALAFGAKEALARTRSAEAAARAYSPKVTNSEGATWSQVVGASALASSGGFAGGYRGTYQSLSVVPLCDDKEGKKRTGHWWTGSRFLAALEEPEAVGREAARRAVAKLGTEKIKTAEMPIVFDPEAGRALLRLLFSVVAGGAIYRKASYLLEREGTEVASRLVTVIDDPLLRRAPGSRPFDGDGLVSRRNVVIDQGKLVTFLLDTYSARKLGRVSNGCAGRGVGGAPQVTTSNFILERGASAPDEIVAGVAFGFYVTEMMGFGFNPVTGDFSRGAAGFLIEGGKKTRPVGEVTVSANFDDLLKSIDAIGSDLELRTSTACPTFRISKMMVAGR